MLDRLFGYDHHKHRNPWNEAPPWAIEIGMMLALIIEQGETTMATLADVQAAQAVTDQKISAVSADVKALMDKVAAIPTGGLTPEQQAAIDDIATHAQKINDALSSIDTTANTNPAPATPPATPAA